MSGKNRLDGSVERSHVSLTLLACFSMLFLAAGVSITPVSINAIGRTHGIDPKLLGSRFFFVEFAAFFVAGIVGGYLADRLGKRLLLRLGFLLLCVGFVLVAWWPAAGWAVLGIGAAGAGGGLTESLGSALLADIHVERRQVYLNLSQAFFSTGAVVGPFAAGMIIQRGLGWRFSYVAVAVLFAVVLAWFTVERMPDPPKKETMAPPLPSGALLRNPILWATCVGIFLYVAGESAVSCWAPQYFIERWGFGVRGAGLMLSLFWCGMIPSRLLGGALYKRVRDIDLVIGTLAFGSIVNAVVFSTNIRAVAICCMPLLGFVWGATWPTIAAYAGRRIPERTGTVFGMVVSSGALGIVAVPPLIGLVAYRYSLRPLLIGAAALSIVSGLLFAELRRRELRAQAMKAGGGGGASANLRS